MPSRARFKAGAEPQESGTNEKPGRQAKFSETSTGIRWRTARPMRNTGCDRQGEIWDYLPDEIVYRYPASMAQDSRSIIQVITGQAALTKDFKIKNLGNENGLVKWRFSPKEASPQMVKKRNIWVEPATGYIKTRQNN